MAKPANKGIVLQVIIAIVLIVGGYLMFSRARTSQYVQYIAYFNNIQGLQPSSGVQINGVRVGKISDITLDGEHLKVMIAVNKNIALNEGTRATLANGNTSGEKIILLKPGEGEKRLPENAVLVSNLDTSVLPISVRITPMIESAKMIMSSADAGLTGIHYLIKGGLATQSMQMLVDIERKATKLEHMAEDLNTNTAGLRAPILNAKHTTANMAANVESTTQSINELEQTTDKISQQPFANSLDTLRKNVSAIGKTFKQLRSTKAFTDKETYEKTTKSAGKTNEGVKDLMKRANE